ncbi:H-NS family nucleoid-associated regulatory protein [Variovorax paradoxus]|uniref:H-NS histone family protein n=1 Tax=Variovorax paradoxus TaxID=34073 RepID=UPI001931B0D9|nr:H-NS histone family protein [Variovorax paradoxus]
MAKKTFQEVQKQIEQLQKEASELRQQEANEVLARIKEAIAVYGFSAAELGVGRALRRTGSARPSRVVTLGRPASAKKASGAQPKYRDEAGNVWSGRGPRPAWFKAALRSGADPGSFLAK